MCLNIYMYTSSNSWTVHGSKPGRGRRFSLIQNCPDCHKYRQSKVSKYVAQRGRLT